MGMNNFLRLTVVSGLFVVPFVPFIVSSSMFFPFISGKNFAFRVIVGILAVLWVLLSIRDSNYRPKKTTILLSLLAFVGVITLADFFGENPYRSFWSNYERMEGLVTHLHLFVYFLMISSVFNAEKLWNRFFFTIFGANLALAGFSLFQLSGVLAINQGGVRIDATFGNATYFAAYVLFQIFLAWFYFYKRVDDTGSLGTFSALGIFVGSVMAIPDGANPGIYFLTFILGFVGASIAFFFAKAWQGRGLLSIVIILDLFLLYKTETRGAILGLIAGVLVTAFLITLSRWREVRVRRVALGAIVGILALIALFITFKDTNFIRTNPTLSRFASISLSDNTTKARFMVWNMSWQGFKERPILGWGQDNFIVVFSKHYDPRMWSQEPWFDRSHNVFLDWMIAGGSLGILSYLALFGSALYVLWRKAKILSSTEKSILAGLLSAYFFQNLFVFDNLTSYINFFSVLGFISFIAYQSDSIEEKSEISPERNTISLAFAPVLVVAVSILIYFADMKPIQAGQTLIKAITPASAGSGISANYDYFKKVFELNTFGSGEAREQLVQLTARIKTVQQLPIEEKQKLFNLAREEMGKQIMEAPSDIRYLLYLGSLLNSYGFQDEALTYLKPAYELSPTKQPVLFELASAYINKGDLKTASEYLEKAYHLDETYPEGKILYATGLIYGGRIAEAEKFLMENFGTKMVGDNRILGAYATQGEIGKVIAIREEQLKNDPKNADLRLNLAAAYLQAGLRTQAVSELKTLINDNPSFKEQGEYYIREIEAGRTP